MSQSSWKKEGNEKSRAWVLANEPQQFVLLIVLLAGLIGSVWYYFHAESETPIPIQQRLRIKAEPGPFRIRPENYGKIDIQHQDKEIYATLDGKQGPEIFQPRQAEEEKPLAIEAPKSLEFTPDAPPQDEQKSPEVSHVKEVKEIPKESKVAVEKLLESVTENPPQRKDLAKQGVYWIRLATVQNYDGALKEWQRIQRMFKDLLGDQKASIAVIDLDNGRRLYPIYLGPFSSAAASEKICSQIKTKVGCLTEKLNS